MTPENSAGAGAHCSGRLDVLELPRPQRLAAREARVADPANHGEGEHDVDEARSEHRHDRDGEQQARKRQQRIDHAADDIVHAPSEVSRNRADDGSDGSRDTDHDHADEEGNPGAAENARQDVPAELVQAERM